MYIVVTEDACLGVSGIYSPRIYAHSTGSSAGSSNGTSAGASGSSGECIGRAVFYRHNRYVFCADLPSMLCQKLTI